MRAVLSVFENYQKARVNFVQTVAELATRPQVRPPPPPRAPPDPCQVPPRREVTAGPAPAPRRR